MRNVVVFSARGNYFAVELGWVREIISLPYVTPVPLGPPACCGIASIRGVVMPIIDVAGVEKGAPIVLAHEGETAIVIDVDRVPAALRTQGIAEVVTLADNTERLMHKEHDVSLVEPPSLFAAIGGRSTQRWHE